MAEKILGKETFGKVTEAMCAMNSSRHAIKLVKHVVSREYAYMLCLFFAQ